MRRALNDTALLLRNSAEVARGPRHRRRRARRRAWYEADEGQIKQIVWNLATNGLRAMPDGGRLRLIGAVEPSADGVVLTVQRRGHRHSAPRSSTACFSRSTARFAKGSGLGLAIVHRIVTDYDGEIQVSSQPGAGTTVSRAAAGAQRRWRHEHTRRSRSTPTRRADRRPPRILVVDDERSMRELLAIVLRREGYDVLLAENGRRAIDAARARAGRSADLRHQDAGHERRRSAARGQADRPGHPRHHDHGVCVHRDAPSKRCGSAPATT